MERPLLRECAHSGCRILTMGPDGALCIRHDIPVAGPFPRGRPYVLTGTAVAMREPEAVDRPEFVTVGFASER
jgi:hypothetical protein